jgi:hypothetical protein
MSISAQYIAKTFKDEIHVPDARALALNLPKINYTYQVFYVSSK